MASIFELEIKISRCKKELLEAQRRGDQTEISRLEKEISMLESELSNLRNQDKDKEPELTM